jgi:MFS family permease
MTAAAQSSRRVHRGVVSPRLKTCVFALAGSNSLATTWFFYYLYFYTRDTFGFSQLQNFELAALLGGVYAVFAYFAGRFAQKAGYFCALRLGLGIMITALLLGSHAGAVWIVLALVIVANIGMCFTWPSLESLMSEGESRERLRSLVGIYNFTWAAASGLAYATSGAMRTSFGPRSMFYAPLVLLALEMFLSIWLERQVNNQPSVASNNPSPRMAPTAELRHSQVPPATFLKMAWLANPMAYLAINTIVATIPTLVLHFHLTQTLAVVVCSVWLFTRAGAFMLLWFWSGWHYRFRFLAGAFAAMVVSFGSMLLATTLWMLVLSQAVLGFSFALMYYSALFYSSRHWRRQLLRPGHCRRRPPPFSRASRKRHTRCLPVAGLRPGRPLLASFQACRNTIPLLILILIPSFPPRQTTAGA